MGGMPPLTDPLADAEIVARVSARILDRLPQVPPEQIQDAVLAVLDGFRHSTVRDFLPVLVEREVLSLLRRALGHDAA
jgi:hypothetical protein